MDDSPTDEMTDPDDPLVPICVAAGNHSTYSGGIVWIIHSDIIIIIPASFHFNCWSNSIDDFGGILATSRYSWFVLTHRSTTLLSSAMVRSPFKNNVMKSY